MASRNCQGRRLDWAICQSEQVADLSDPWCKLLFTWLIPNTDNCGRLDGEPYQVAGTVFPLEMEKGTVTVTKVDKWLGELRDAGLIIWYQSGRLRYIQLPKFLEHQTLTGNMKAVSDYPAPDEASIQTWKVIEEAVNTPSIPRTDDVSTEDKAKGKDKDLLRASEGERLFEEFWKRYPRKRAKGNALKAYTAALKKTHPEVILAGLESQLPIFAGQEAQYVPYPATWLNAERWLDEPPKTALETVDEYWGGDDIDY